MKRATGWFVLAGLALAAGCSTPYEGNTTSVALAGAPGTTFSGYYVQNGRRVDISGAVPVTVTYPSLSELVIRKEHPEETLFLVAQNHHGVWRYETGSEAGTGLSGLRLRVCDGLAVEKLKL